MKRTIATFGFVLAAFGLCAAQLYPKFVPPPPGTVVQNVTVFLTGQGMSSHWQAIASKRVAGRNAAKQNVYQWWLSVYSPPDGDTAKLQFRTPGNSDILPAVEKAKGANMYFPYEVLKIAGGAQLEHPQVDDLVIVARRAGVDCGSATVAIIGSDEQLHTHERVRVDNPCDLRAKIVPDGQLQAVQLDGPYYTQNTPLCCPAKPHARAILRYRGGKWVMTPAYFALRAARRP